VAPRDYIDTKQLLVIANYYSIHSTESCFKSHQYTLILACHWRRRLAVLAPTQIVWDLEQIDSLSNQLFLLLLLLLLCIKLTVATIVILRLVLSFSIDKLQRRELPLNSSASLAAFEALNALLVFIAPLKPYNLLNMMRNSCNPLLIGTLKRPY
jgi:hypothetical protein